MLVLKGTLKRGNPHFWGLHFFSRWAIGLQKSYAHTVAIAETIYSLTHSSAARATRPKRISTHLLHGTCKPNCHLKGRASWWWPTWGNGIGMPGSPPHKSDPSSSSRTWRSGFLQERTWRVCSFSGCPRSWWFQSKPKEHRSCVLGSKPSEKGDHIHMATGISICHPPDPRSQHSSPFGRPSTKQLLSGMNRVVGNGIHFCDTTKRA